MPSKMCIRDGQLNDAELLAVLAAQVWWHTYATDGVNGEIARYVLSALAPERYLALLNDPESHLFVAEHGACMVGFAVVKWGAPCPTDPARVAELQTLYVQEHFLGHGVGKALLHAAESRVRALSGSALWLTVNAKNTRAKGFYARQGYTKVGSTDFVLGETRHENDVLVGPGT